MSDQALKRSERAIDELAESFRELGTTDPERLKAWVKYMTDELANSALLRTLIMRCVADSYMSRPVP